MLRMLLRGVTVVRKERELKPSNEERVLVAFDDEVAVVKLVVDDDG